MFHTTYNPNATAKLKQLIDGQTFAPDIAMLLVTNKADPHIENQFDQPFLHLLAQQNRFDLVKILVKKFNVDIDVKNGQGKTLLAIYHDEIAHLKILTTRNYQDEVKKAKECIELGAKLNEVNDVLDSVKEELNKPIHQIQIKARHAFQR